MDDTSTNLTLPYLQAAQAQKHVTHNAALERLDLIVQLVLQSFAEATPPTAPDEGQVWAVAAGATGAYAGHEGELAAWSNGGWLFVIPRPGWRGVLGTELRVWSGSAWVAPDLPALQNLPGLGIGSSYDATNRLAVSSAAVLLTHAGAGHQLKVNKNAAADTASLLFQTGWSGRAEMGTMGSDAFGVKVSADGSSWHTALSVNASTGVATLGQGAVVTGSLTGTAVTQTTTDTTAGRLMKGGDFGLGATTAAPTIADFNDQTLPAGLYAYGSTALNRPSTLTSFGHLLIMRQATTGVAQIAFSSNGSSTVWRTATAGLWNAWRRLDTERGSNANGEYVRLDDGTQICWHATLSGSVWTYPAAFLAAPAGWSVLRAGANARIPAVDAISATGATPRLYNTAATEVTGDGIRVCAIGRWF